MTKRYIRYEERISEQKKYGFWHHLFDFIMVLITGGLWLIWIMIRYFRTNSR